MKSRRGPAPRQPAPLDSQAPASTLDGPEVDPGLTAPDDALAMQGSLGNAALAKLLATQTPTSLLAAGSQETSGAGQAAGPPPGAQLPAVPSAPGGPAAGLSAQVSPVDVGAPAQGSVTHPDLGGGLAGFGEPSASMGLGSDEPIGDYAGALADALRSEGALQAAAVHGHFSDALAGNEGAVLATREALAARFDAVRGALSAQAVAATGTLSAEGEQHQGAVLTHGRAHADRLGQGVEAQQVEALHAAESAKASVHETATAEGLRAQVESEAHAAEVDAAAEGRAAGSDPALGEAQSSSAQQIAAATGERVEASGEHMSQEAVRVADEASLMLDGQQQTLASRAEEGLAQSTLGLQQQSASAAQALEDMAARATAGVFTIGDTGSAALDAREEALTAQLSLLQAQDARALSQAEDEVCAQLAEATERIAGQVEAEGAAAPGLLDPAVTEGVEADLTEAANQGHEQLSQVGDSVADELGEHHVGLDTRLTLLRSGVVDDLDCVSAELEDELTAYAEGGAEAMALTSSDVQLGLSECVDDTLAASQAEQQRWRDHVELGAGELSDALACEVDAGLDAQGEEVAAAEQGMDRADQEMRAQYDGLMQQAQGLSAEEARGSGWDSVTGAFSELLASARAWLAHTFGDWWGGFVYGLLSELSAVLVIVGVLAAVAALFTPLAAAIVAVVMLVVMAIVGVVHRSSTFLDDNGRGPGLWEALALLGVGLTDLTGLPMIIEGLVGQRAFGPELADFEAGANVGGGLVRLVTIFFGLSSAKAARGSRRGAAAPEGRSSQPVRKRTETSESSKGAPDARAATAPPKTLAELRARLSEEGREGFDQLRELGGDEPVEGMARKHKTADGSYDVAAADAAFQKVRLGKTEFAEKLAAREAKAWS